MDVSGRAPSAEVGRYFRASIRQWPGIMQVVEQANALGALRLDTAGWMHNDGAGAGDQATCDRLAASMERVLSSMEEPVIRTAHHPAFEAMLAQTPPGYELHPDTSRSEVSVEKVRAFVAFLRACGRFEVH